MKDSVVVYHGNCTDGSAAAACAYGELKDKAIFKKGIHGRSVDIEIFRNKEIYFLDFCYSKDVMLAIRKIATKITILDHHKTAFEDLISSMDYEGYFDMNRSGAKIAFDWFNPVEINSNIIELIQDKDLGKNEMPKGKEVNSFLFSMMPFEESTAEEWLNILSQPVDFVCALGLGSLKSRETLTKLGVARAYRARLFGKDIWIANATECFCEIASVLKERGEFGACFYQNDEGRYVYSLQSNRGVDVSTLARSVGGGGHENAAGFTADAPLHVKI